MHTHARFGIGLACLALLGLSGCGGYQDDLQEGLVDLQRGNYPDAVRHFKRVAQRQPLNATAYSNLGIAYWKLGATGEAVDALTVAADLEGRDPRPLLLLAFVLEDGRRWDEAREVLARVNQNLPNRADIQTHLARLEYQAGRIEAAAALLDEALKLDPGYGPALYNMAVLARDQHADNLTAMRFFSRYLSVANDPVRIDRVHGELARLRQPFRPPTSPPSVPVPPAAALSPPPPSETALPVVAPAVLPATVPALLEQAEHATAAQSYDEALVLLGKARGLEPRNADVLWATATLYDRLDQTPKADTVLKDFVRLFPDDSRSAMARQRLGRALPAADTPPPLPPAAPVVTTTSPTTTTSPPPPPTTTASPAIRSTGGRRPAIQDLWSDAKRAHNAGRWDEAIRGYESVLARDPKFASAAYNMGVAYKAKGDLPAAARAFEHALDLDSRLSNAAYMLAVVHREQGDPEGALVAAKRALSLNPEDDNTHYLLGLLYRDAMRFDLARHHFKRAMDTAKDRASVEKARVAINSLPPPGGSR